MKKIGLLFFAMMIITSFMAAQTAPSSVKEKLYNPEADAKSEIAAAVKKAEMEDKHVLIQIGGNWCRWCLMFDEKVTTNDTLRTALEENYVIYHLNYSKENLNKDIMSSFDFPQRFGFPVFVVLDSNGKRIHTQNSVYLEQEEGHSSAKILEFFNHWSPTAIDASSYEE